MACRKPPCLTNGLFFRNTIQGSGVPSGPCWILDLGFWADACFWVDNDNWID